MNQTEIGSQWDKLMCAIIKTGKYFAVDSFNYTDEVNTIKYLNRNAEIRDELNCWLSTLSEKRSRSVVLSKGFRDKGNEFFRDATKPFDLAADYYTNAIFSAPEDSVELAYGHANRAACFERMGMYLKEGYNDCQLALHFNYPLEKRLKILERKFSLATSVEAKHETLLEMEELIEKQVCKAADIQLELRQKEYEEAQASANSECDPSTDPAVTENKRIIQKYDASVGRYVVAGENIERKQPIYREKAFSFVPVLADMDPNSISYNCQSCAKVNCIPFPCCDCMRASYCSTQCVEQHKSIHRFECAGYQKNLWAKIGIAQLSLRTFITGFGPAIELLSEEKTLSPVEVVLAMCKLDDAHFAYGEVLRLLTNFYKSENEDILSYALTAQMLVQYLDTCTDFFADLPPKCIRIMPNVNDWKMFSAAMILRHMGHLVTNGHAISNIQLMPPSMMDYSYQSKGFEQIDIENLHLVTSNERCFTALFPRISILNHSCSPNIYNRFDGSFLTIMALKDIAEGEEIFNCYGPAYKLNTKAERQEILKHQYAFDCKCTICSSEDEKAEKYDRYICPNERCRMPISLNLPDRNWWMAMADDQFMEAITPNFYCSYCNNPLLLNPSSFGVFLEITKADENTGFCFKRSKAKTQAAISYYKNVSRCLGKFHILKAIMAQHLLSYKMNNDRNEMFMKLTDIAMEHYVITRERHGLLSLEMISSAMLALNILKMAKQLEKDKKYSQYVMKEFEQIRIVFDATEMEETFSILPPSVQTTFQHALNSVNQTE